MTTEQFDAESWVERLAHALEGTREDSGGISGRIATGGMYMGGTVRITAILHESFGSSTGVY